MAAKTLFGNAFRISTERGQWRDLGTQARGLATWHPSAVLRMPREDRRHEAYAELVADLREVALALAILADETVGPAR
jgi:uracil-DNA glycosylase